ncbi:MAG: ATP-binding cassette domain-containing protein [Bacteroidota bacterium]|nr:ATP-binding cassette domain-containing protein [Candidatus Kapabacteria bacterium]MDW8220010.1 ATP-binding cassette domain-containing protein [Bacteroidota bacterium]
MTEIRLVNVSKRYHNGVQAVHSVSLTFDAGRFTVLLGPSGCGKTTILRMIAGLETVTAGDIYFGAERVNDLHPKDRDIGMVFQNYALYPHLNVFDNIAFPLRVRRMPKQQIQHDVYSVAAMVGVSDLLDRKPKELSGGQRQRVALARAIIRKPRVFLFDEPLSNLDAQLRHHMRTEIVRVQRIVGSTAVYVTHDQDEAMTMADTIVVLHQGVVQQVGVPSAIYTQPANRFVAGFIGNPPMNFFDGELRPSATGFEFWEHGALSSIRLGSHLRVQSEVPQKVLYATLAVRPEHCSLLPLSYATPGEEYTCVGVVRRVEFMGHEYLVYVETSEQTALKIIRLLQSTSYIPSITESVVLRMESEFCCLFDTSGKRL